MLEKTAALWHPALRVQIYIPTLGRLNKVSTWDRLTPALQAHTLMVCSKEEEPEHRKRGRNTWVCPVQGRLTPVRQWILDNTNADLAFFIDDDVRFDHRESKYHWHLKPNDKTTTEHLFTDTVKAMTRGYGQVGCSARLANNGFLELPSTHCARQWMWWAVHMPVVRSNGVGVELPVMSDFELCIKLLRRGYANLFWTEQAVGQTCGVNASGGVSRYRTAPMVQQAAEQIQKLATYAKLVERKSKTWQGITHRVDVQVQWKQVWQSASCYHGDLSDPRYVAKFPARVPCRITLIQAPQTIRFHTMSTDRCCKVIRYSGAEWNQRFAHVWRESLENPHILLRWTDVEEETYH